MSDQRSCREADARLAERLLRGGISPRHVRRTLRELRDHRSDIVAGLERQGYDVASCRQQAQQLLGSHEQLAERMLAQPALRSRTRRYAWLLFGVAPFVAVAVLCCALLLAVVAAIGEPAKATPEDMPLLRWSLAAFKAAALWAIPAAVGLVLCRIAAQRRMTSVWPLISFGAVAVVSGLSRMDVSLAGGLINARFGVPPFGISRALVLFCALLVVWLLVRRAAHTLQHSGT